MAVALTFRARSFVQLVLHLHQDFPYPHLFDVPQPLHPMESPRSPPSQTVEDTTRYFFMAAAIIAVALLLFFSNIVSFACCFPGHLVQLIRRLLRSRGRLDNGRWAQMIPVCKYQKEQQVAEISECSVCLSVFIDGEDVRQMPVCKHLFHAPCIDMWLYSHSDCPLCRANVLPPPFSSPTAGGQQDSRLQLLVDNSRIVDVPVVLV